MQKMIPLRREIQCLLYVASQAVRPVRQATDSAAALLGNACLPAWQCIL